MCTYQFPIFNQKFPLLCSFTRIHTHPLHDFLSQIAVIPHKCIAFTPTHMHDDESVSRKLPWNGLSEKQCNCHSITTKEAHASYNRKRIKCMLPSHPLAWDGRECPQWHYFNAFHSCGFVYLEWRKDRFSERHRHKRYQFSLPCTNILYVYFETLKSMETDRERDYERILDKRGIFDYTMQFCSMTIINIRKYKQHFPMKISQWRWDRRNRLY